MHSFEFCYETMRFQATVAAVVTAFATGLKKKRKKGWTASGSTIHCHNNPTVIQPAPEAGKRKSMTFVH